MPDHTRKATPERDGILADPRLGRIGAALGLAFAALVASGLHGFSLASWHDVIDRSEPAEVWLGSPRYLRADDWLVQLPLAYAQSAHDPPFPVENQNLGGQNMLLPIEVPVASPVMLLRPTFWGFLLGDDVGTAWLWWSQVLGVFGAWLLLFCVVGEGRVGLAAAAALLFTVSPHFQFWSFSKSTLPIGLALCAVAAIGIASARTRRGLVGCALLLGGAGAMFAVNLYPPHNVSLGYVLLVATGAWLLDPRHRERWRTDLGARLGAVAGAGAMVAIAAGVFASEAGDAIALMQQTAYPGTRVSTGGEAASWRLFTSHFAAALSVEDWGPLVNVVEIASFWFSFPLIALALAVGRSRDPVALALAALCLAIVGYREIGIPEGLARASLLSYVPDYRVTLALGCADLLLLVRWLAVRRETRAIGRPTAALLAVAWTLALGVAGIAMRQTLPELPIVAITLGSASAGGVGYLLVRRWRPAVTLGAVATALAVTTLWWNPLARGGVEFLRGNALSRELLAIDRAHAGPTLWLTYGSSDLANLPRVLGLPSIGGNTNLPDLERWSHLDPDGASREIYNRYAHVAFRAPRRPGSAPRFQLSSPHGFRVTLDPTGPEIRTLGVTHLLVRLRRSSLPFWARFEPIARIEPDLLVYTLPLQPRSTPPTAIANPRS